VRQCRRTTAAAKILPPLGLCSSKKRSHSGPSIGITKESTQFQQSSILMQSNPVSRPSSSSGFRPSTSKQDAPVAPSNIKLYAAVEKHGSFMNALTAISTAEFADKLVQVWSVFYDRCRFLDGRISPSGYLSWTEVKGVFSYLHIQKLVSERNLRVLFSDLGTTQPV
jgi:hypothetical protein